MTSTAERSTSAGQCIRIAVVEDQAMVREALTMMLALEAGFEVVGQAENGNAALALVKAHRPQVVVTDIEMPEMDGITLTEQLSKTYPDVRVLVVTTFGFPGYLRRAIDAGALGFIVKDSPVKILAAAIRAVADGKRVVDPDLAAESLAVGRDPLTEREREILREVEKGGSTASIAARLFLSPGTVRNHLSAIIAKTTATSSVEAATLARRNGWL